jgi:hypothetical protein
VGAIGVITGRGGRSTPGLLEPRRYSPNLLPSTMRTRLCIRQPSRRREKILLLYWRLIAASEGDGTHDGQAAVSNHKSFDSWLWRFLAVTMRQGYGRTWEDGGARGEIFRLGGNDGMLSA